MSANQQDTRGLPSTPSPLTGRGPSSTTGTTSDPNFHAAQLCRAAFEGLRHGVVVYNLDLDVVMMNARARELLEVPPGLFQVGEPFERLVRINAMRGGYGNQDSVETRIGKRMAKARAFVAFREDQSLFNGKSIEVFGQPLGENGFVLTYTDITERVKAEGAETAATARFRDFARASSDWLWETDSEHRFSHLSGRLTELTGLPISDYLGRRREEVAGGDIAPEELSKLQRAIASHEPFDGVTYARTLPDGLERHFVISGVPVFGPRGEFAGYRGTGRDISALKATERALVKAKEAAETANRAKSAFLANMSHEIRTPMNGVVGMAEVLSRLELPDEQSKMVRTIRDSSMALLRIIEDILDVSKVEAEQLDLEDRVVSLREITENVLQPMRVIAKQHNVRLLLDFDPTVVHFIRSDPLRLRQVMTNLLNNGIKFSRRAPALPPGIVWLRVAPDGPAGIEISVSDNGIGMDEGFKERLFQPFSQQEDSTTRDYGGAGLGLAITRELVHLMGGTITVESEVGEGSRFDVRLPVTVAAGQLDDPDVSGIDLLVYAPEQVQQATGDYLSHRGVRLHFFDNEQAMLGFLPANPTTTVVVVAVSDRGECERVLREVRAIDPKARFLVPVIDPIEWSDMASEDVYLAQRYPMLPSEQIRALAALTGRGRVPSPGERDEPESENKPASSQRKPQRILLVEDNETNQNVIASQLDLLGYAVECAPNGVEGLERWSRGEFDLVLTDCHMPSMDGFQLARQIRAFEQEHGAARVPLIAVTANAVRGEARRCVDAGMDGYLSKPVELKRLEQTINTWLARPPSGEPERPEPDQTPDDEREHLDGLVNPSAMIALIGDQPAMHRRFLESFLGPAEQIVGEINEKFADRCSTGIAELGHKLKSSARTVGADPLADLCAELENAGQSEAWGDLESLQSELSPLFVRTKAVIEGMIGVG